MTRTRKQSGDERQRRAAAVTNANSSGWQEYALFWIANTRANPNTCPKMRLQKNLYPAAVRWVNETLAGTLVDGAKPTGKATVFALARAMLRRKAVFEEFLAERKQFFAKREEDASDDNSDIVDETIVAQFDQLITALELRASATVEIEAALNRFEQQWRSRGLGEKVPIADLLRELIQKKTTTL